MVNWNEKALGKQDFVINDLKQLVSIPSVLDESLSTEDAPFGPEPKRALDWLLEEGRKAGFTVKNIDNMAGHIEMGEGDELLGILCHVDVVPAGSNWTYGPFEGTVKDGKLFGRGAIDDKGPTIAAWHAMKMVKEAGIPLNKRVRLIIGTDEESGFRCVRRYFEKEEMPTIGFAPDADFPIINAEKGISSLVFSQKTNTPDGQLLAFESGSRTNMVPDVAQAVIGIGYSEIKDRFESFLDRYDYGASTTGNENETTIRVNGKSAHAMEPNNGVNAAIVLVSFLNEIFTEGASKDFTQFLVDAFGNETRGRYLGLDFNDEISGDTTLNAGIVSYTPEEGGRVNVSMRYSVTYPFEEKVSNCNERLKDAPFELEVKSNSKPHHVDANDPFIKTLQDVYTTYTGEEAELLSIGGGTYARVLDKGVAFGMLFPGRDDVAHQADEYVYIEDLIKATAIYAAAISRLASDEEGES
ncbi:dipeptidase PepV [Sporosarcina highlanderae]|uniref:Dipeptidase PepV n=1 Tax=Sporosarcina highlanderae TaxID=3035916 RepID=A0ABT8JRE7_9BACL|nr:dipeptidase PepV [Sporosarcina highlanderae]MDN4606977.1 dipeptidase PepV [Sporosarcina highlanderae]